MITFALGVLTGIALSVAFFAVTFGRAMGGMLAGALSAMFPGRRLVR